MNNICIILHHFIDLLTNSIALVIADRHCLQTLKTKATCTVGVISNFYDNIPTEELWSLSRGLLCFPHTRKMEGRL